MLAKTKRGFYRRMAWDNLVRNRRMYVPYLIASAVMSGMFAIVLNLAFSKSITNMSNGDTVSLMFRFGCVVMGLLTVGYMLYINSFLIKRRKKEFGLYGVLGLEKRHVGRIIFWENFILNVSSLGLGLLGSVVLGRLVFMLLMLTLNVAPGSRYIISPLGIIITVVVFTAIFICTTIYNRLQVSLAKPIDLINGDKKRERRLRHPLVHTIFGGLCLAAGYVISALVDGPGLALGLFWPAVILVIIGTNELFFGGSVFILGALKKNKKIYYKPRNFIFISSLIHRMKQNAAGLANICILSTMVLVTVSGVGALYFGHEQVNNDRYPDDMTLTVIVNKTSPGRVQELTDIAAQCAAEHGVTLDNVTAYMSRDGVATTDSDGRLYFVDADGALFPESGKASDRRTVCDVDIITQDEYRRLTGEEAGLSGDSLLALYGGQLETVSAFSTPGGEFPVAGYKFDSPLMTGDNSTRSDLMIVVAADDDAAQKFGMAIAAHSDLEPQLLRYEMYVNLSGDSDECGECVEDIVKTMARRFADDLDEGGYAYSNRFPDIKEAMSIYGGFLFLGAFFTILFLTNTVLLMFFKQVSEGMDDAERFRILRQIGLSDDEVRRTINRQVRTVFFLPLLTALIHMAACTNMLTQMLKIFMLDAPLLTVLCIAVTCAVFAVIYAVVYKITAKVYYRLVK